MKLYLLLPIVCLGLSGCILDRPTLSNEEMVKAIKLCHSYGLMYDYTTNMSGQVLSVNCRPEDRDDRASH